MEKCRFHRANGVGESISIKAFQYQSENRSIFEFDIDFFERVTAAVLGRSPM
jgi:hypothetical protein